MSAEVIDMQSVVGKGYADFWHWRGRYRVVIGSRSSKKSKTAALNFIHNIMDCPGANLLAVRKVAATLRTSCFVDLKWATERLGVARLWKSIESPLEMTFLPTGQKIYFRGLDDPLKITSIAVLRGHLCWGWLEEAYEVKEEDDFKILDESIRGAIPSHLWKQWTLTLNPWNKEHWINKRFYERKDDDVLSLQKDYLCNEWLDPADLKLFKKMKEDDPRRYWVAGLGNWGVVDGLVYENWREEDFDADELRKLPGVEACYGLDFGWNHPTALFCGLIDNQNKRLWVYDEIYRKETTLEALYKEMCEKGLRFAHVVSDRAEPRSREHLRSLGMRNITRSSGGRVRAGIMFLQEFEIIVHRKKCPHFLTEISTYCWAKDEFGKKIDEPQKLNDDLMAAMRYATEKYMREPSFRWPTG